MTDSRSRALVLVDIQRDFMPDGPLPTRDGYGVVPVANRLQPYFDIVLATKDWHPVNHVSFASRHEGKKPFDQIQLGDLAQTLWPDHCIQNTPGAEFVQGLKTSRIRKVFRKGANPELDSYSGFFDNAHLRSTGLGEWLRARGIADVYLVGVATEVCVKYTALDARELGFQTWVVRDGTRGVEARPGDLQHSLEEMNAAGVRVIDSATVAERFQQEAQPSP